MNVPESYSFNERILAFEPKPEDFYFTASDGSYENIIYTGIELREADQIRRDEFRQWLKESNKQIPVGYQENNADIRIVNAKQGDFDKAYEDILIND